MADHDIERPGDARIGRGPRGVRGNYYSPPTAIKDVLGVVKKKGREWVDWYSGTAEALIAAGLLPAELFPGQPGRNSTSQSYRPLGQTNGRSNNEGWHLVPGYMTITRQGSGRFQIHLTVSLEEQARRDALREEARDAQHAQRSSWTPRGSVTPEERLSSATLLIDTAVGLVGVEEVQRLLDALKPRRPRPRENYLRLVVSAAA